MTARPSASSTAVRDAVRQSQWSLVVSVVSFVVGLLMLVAEQFHLPEIAAHVAGIQAEHGDPVLRVMVMSPFLVGAGGLVPTGVRAARNFFKLFTKRG